MGPMPKFPGQKRVCYREKENRCGDRVERIGHRALFEHRYQAFSSRITISLQRCGENRLGHEGLSRRASYHRSAGNCEQDKKPAQRKTTEHDFTQIFSFRFASADEGIKPAPGYWRTALASPTGQKVWTNSP